MVDSKKKEVAKKSEEKKPFPFKKKDDSKGKKEKDKGCK